MLWESLGGIFPSKVYGSGVGLWCWGHPQGGPGSADEAPPFSPGTDTGPDPSPALLAELLMSPASLTPKAGLYPPALLVLGRGREASGHKGQRCFISISPQPSRCLATLLPALSFASGKCLSPYHHPDRNLTSPCGEEWKNLSMENLRSSLAALSGEQGLKRVVSPIQRVTKADQSQRTAHSLVLAATEILSAALPCSFQSCPGFSLALKATDNHSFQHFPQGKEDTCNELRFFSS